MLTTSYTLGSPNWTDLGTPDTDASAAFYGALFGWSFQSAGPDAGGYGMFVLEGRTVAAIGPLTEEGAGSAWTLYFHTPDAQATAKTVEQAGGTVRFGPFDVFSQGRMAGLTDPTGARFAVWQPGETKGLEAVTETNTLCWTELFTGDPGQAKSFYRAVFGWETQDTPLDGTTYSVILPSGGGREGAQGGIMPIGEEVREAGVGAQWVPYFEVADCDGVAALASAKGGGVLMPATSVQGVGRLALLTDPFGAHFYVIASSADPS